MRNSIKTGHQNVRTKGTEIEKAVKNGSKSATAGASGRKVEANAT